MLGKTTNVLLPTLLLLGSLSVQAASTALLNQATELMTQQRPSEALALLEQSMESDAGDPQYDYLLGQAALASNKPNLAVFALERVVMNQPSAAMPRLTLARAYLALEEYDQAESEVLQLKRQRHNANIQRVSDQYLQSITQAKRAQSRQFGLQINLGLGYDSNANSATTIDKFGITTLSENSKATASNTGIVGLTGTANLPLSRKLRSESAIQLMQSDYADASFVNTRSAMLNTALNYRSSKNSNEIFQLQAVHTDVEEKLNNRQANLQFTHQSKQNNHQWDLSAKAVEIRYADQYSSRDVQQVSASLQYSLRNSNHLLSSLSLMVGEENPLESDSIYGRQFNAAQAGIVWNQGKASTIASVSYMQSNYDSQVFMTDRNDNNIGASLKVNYKLNSKWMIGPSLKFARNQSSVDLYDYDRNQAMLFISHQVI